MNNLRLLCALTVPLAICAQSLFADSFAQSNLTSDIPGLAAVTDPNLQDAWGVSFGTGSPIWISDRASGVSTLYNGTGAPQGGPLVVTVPPGNPTGQVFAGPTTAFRLNGNPVAFIFATLNGTIDAWNGTTTATVEATTAGANFTGLALANNTLYAANFQAGGGISVFNSSFAPTTLAGNFTDPNAIAGYAPFNVQNINGDVYVEYAKVTPGVPVALPGGGGYVDEFDANGNFIRRFTTDGPLDGPWGIAAVPATGFGGLAAGDLLIGNFAGGDIDAFDNNGNFLEALDDESGNPINNPGLWALTFDSGLPGTTDTNALYFTVGLNQGNDGLFGKIDPTPEPAAWSLAVLGLVGLAALRRKRIAALR